MQFLYLFLCTSISHWSEIAVKHSKSSIQSQAFIWLLICVASSEAFFFRTSQIMRYPIVSKLFYSFQPLLNEMIFLFKIKFSLYQPNPLIDAYDTDIFKLFVRKRWVDNPITTKKLPKEMTSWPPRSFWQDHFLYVLLFEVRWRGLRYYKVYMHDIQHMSILVPWEPLHQFS